MSSQDGDIFQIEKILKHRVDKKRGKLYYIKWQGWNSNHNTWEPEENILDKDLLEAYNNGKMTARTPAKRTPVATQRRASGSRAKRAKYDSDQDSSAANNSVVSASPIQSEGYLDVEDPDKEPEEPVEQPKAKSKSKSPVPEVPEAQPEPESIAEEPEPKKEEVVEEVVEPTTEAPSEEPVEEEKVVEKKVEEEKVEEKEEKKEEAESIEFFAYPSNGGGEESNEFHVTEQNDPQCEVKIQVASQPTVTLQTEETVNDQTPDPVADTQEVVAQEEEKVFESNTASEPFDQ